MTQRRRRRICFVASGGGHLNELLQVAPAFSGDDWQFVTERTALGESVAKDYPTRFVPHFAYGQPRLEGYGAFLWKGATNALLSLWALVRFRPDVIISSGAGTAYFSMLFARLTRRKVVYIESIARVTEISLFGRMAARFAGLTIVQWPTLEGLLPGAVYCDPLKIEPPSDRPPSSMTLVTVGTLTQFDRMVGAVEALAKAGIIEGQIVAQVGNSKASFDGMTVHETLPYEDMNRLMEESDTVICHAGSGSILGALNAGCHVVVMARREELGEHYDNHQYQITEAFQDLGLVSHAADADDLERAVNEARSRGYRRVTIDPTAMVDEIERYLAI